MAQASTSRAQPTKARGPTLTTPKTQGLTLAQGRLLGPPTSGSLIIMDQVNIVMIIKNGRVVNQR